MPIIMAILSIALLIWIEPASAQIIEASCLVAELAGVEVIVQDGFLSGEGVAEGVEHISVYN